MLGSPTSPSSKAVPNSCKLGSPGNVIPLPVKDGELHSSRVLSEDTTTLGSLTAPQYLERVLTSNGSLSRETQPSVTLTALQSSEKVATNGNHTKSTRVSNVILDSS